MQNISVFCVLQLFHCSENAFCLQWEEKCWLCMACLSDPRFTDNLPFDWFLLHQGVTVKSNFYCTYVNVAMCMESQEHSPSSWVREHKYYMGQLCQSWFQSYFRKKVEYTSRQKGFILRYDSPRQFLELDAPISSVGSGSTGPREEPISCTIFTVWMDTQRTNQGQCNHINNIVSLN